MSRSNLKRECNLQCIKENVLLEDYSALDPLKDFAYKHGNESYLMKL